MRSPHVRALAGALAWLALTACEMTSAPLPDPTQIALQQSDLPAGLQRCTSSGDIGGFMRGLQRGNPAAHDELAGAWRDLQHRGALQASIVVFVEQPAACGARLGTGQGTTLTSVVVRFSDDTTAAAAYQRGILGFTTPNENAEVADMNRGAATGIGRNAWVIQRTVQGRSLIVGLWERHAILVLFVAVDSDPLHAKQALAAVDGRIP